MDELLLTRHLATDSVRIVLFDGERFALVQEFDDETWKLPGGKFEANETALTAARRELHEELGIQGIDLRYAGMLPNSDGISKRYIFTGDATDQDVIPTVEVANTVWVTLATIPLAKHHRHISAAVELAQSLGSTSDIT